MKTASTGFYYWQKAIVIGSAIASAVGLNLLYTNPSIAQITPDATLPNNSKVDSVNETLNITGGTSAGGNLFHSFKEFSVPNGWEAIFNNGADIQNILTRVSGKSISQIDGLIKANGSANLFLINPNGIFFGENARLDIGGSFIGSTANGIGIDNQDFFSLLNSQPNSQLLTIKPNTLFLNQIQGGKIETSSTQLRVPDGKSLLLAGGDININGGGLRADGGRIDLAGLAESGALGLNINNNELSLSVPDDLTRADISVVNNAIIDVRAGGGGSIVVNARSLEVKEGSQLFSGIREGLGSAESVGGDITINATDKVIFDRQGNERVTVATSFVATGAEGKAGDVEITTGSLQILNGARLSASTLGIGDAGSVKISATDKVIFDGQGSDFFTGAGSQLGTEAQGKAGGVEITTASLQILNGAELSASTFGNGDAGSVKIIATDKVIFDGQGSDFFTGAASQVRPGAEGNAGGVEITTGSLQIVNGAQVGVSTFGNGDAGSVKINATDKVIFDGQGNDLGTGAGSTVESGAKGNAGGVEITTGSLQILNSGFVSTGSSGSGEAGALSVNADSILLDNQGEIRANTTGGGGDIFVNSPLLVLRRGSSITTNASGNNISGGNITIDGKNGFIVAFPWENSDIRADSEDFRGGDVKIKNTAGIYGIFPRNEPLPNSSDITVKGATPDLEGNIEVNPPELDPTSGLVELPVDVPDASNKISNACTPQNQDRNTFISTGRGGLPMSPSEPLQETSTLSTWVRLKPQSQNSASRIIKPSKTVADNNIKQKNQIVEATGWIVDKDGNIEFVAQANQTNFKSPNQIASCTVSK